MNKDTHPIDTTHFYYKLSIKFLLSNNFKYRAGYKTNKIITLLHFVGLHVAIISDDDFLFWFIKMVCIKFSREVEILTNGFWTKREQSWDRRCVMVCS